MGYIEGFIKNPIPTQPRKVDGWKKVQIEECGEPLVAVGPLTDYDCIAQDAIYYGERISSPYHPKGLEGSLITPFMRLDLAGRLKMAQDLLPDGHLFLVWDAYRTLQTQKGLFGYYKEVLAQQKPNASSKELEEAAEIFVSRPSKDPTKPSPHNTGGVVDLTIIRIPIPLWKDIQRQKSQIYGPFSWERNHKYELLRWQTIRELADVLDMGTPFDFFGPETETNYYEHLALNRELTLKERGVLFNRRLLFNTLREVGIENYEEEWWHYSYGDQMWAKKVGEKAIYGSAILSEDNLVHEQLIRNHYRFHIRMLEGNMEPPIVYPDTEENRNAADLYEKIHIAAGDPRISNHPLAAQL